MVAFGVLVAVVPAAAAAAVTIATTVFVASDVVFGPSCETFLSCGFAVLSYQIIMKYGVQARYC